MDILAGASIGTVEGAGGAVTVTAVPVAGAIAGGGIEPIVPDAVEQL
jgi:hypothetical protein